MQAFICVGILLAYLVGLPYQHNEPQQIVIGSEAVSWWRIMFLFGIAPAVLQVSLPCLHSYNLYFCHQRIIHAALGLHAAI